jgi:hypothetical protein
MEVKSEGCRIVVTGHDQRGSAVFDQDRVVHPVDLGRQGVRATFLWGRDDIPSFPDDGAMPAFGPGQPPPGGSRLSTLTIPAGANQAYFDFIVAALGDLADADQPGFHVTPTLDYIVVLSGVMRLELDDGQVRELSRGDIAVLNGVRHRWSNPGTEDATLLAAQIGAHRA